MLEISHIITLITLALTLILSFSEIRRRRAESDKSRADAAETLTESVLKLLTPKDEEINRLNIKLSSLTAQIVVMEEDRRHEKEKFDKEISNTNNRIAELNHQMEFIIGELKRSDTALEYLASVVQVTYPKEAEQAIKIRRGQIILPKTI